MMVPTGRPSVTSGGVGRRDWLAGGRDNRVRHPVAGVTRREGPVHRRGAVDAVPSLLVVSAAASAFAGWTALEVVFGNRIQTALSPFVLDLFTGLLFCLFAVLLYRSAPGSSEPSFQTDGGAVVGSDGELDVQVPSWAGTSRTSSVGSSPSSR